MTIILKEQISTIIRKEAPTFGDKTIALRRPFLKVSEGPETGHCTNTFPSIPQK